MRGVPVDLWHFAVMYGVAWGALWLFLRWDKKPRTSGSRPISAPTEDTTHTRRLP